MNAIDDLLRILTVQQIENLFNVYASFAASVSHRMALLTRCGPDLKSMPVTVFASAYIRRRARSALSSLNFQAKKALYSSACSNPYSRAYAGFVYEAIVFDLLREDGFNGQMYPMVRVSHPGNSEPGATPGKKRSPHPQYYTAYGSVSSNSGLQKLRVQAIASPVTQQVSLTEVREFPDDPSVQPHEVEEDILYVPSATNQVAIDAFFVHGGIAYLLQCTISSAHEIKPGLLSLREVFQLPPSLGDWRIVMVQPGPKLLTSRYEASLEDIPRHSFILPVKDVGLPALTEKEQTLEKMVGSDSEYEMDVDRDQ